MCVSENVLYVSHKGVPGGVIAINMSDRAVEVVVKNGSAHCVERSHVVYADTGSRQIKAKVPGKEVIIIAGNCKCKSQRRLFFPIYGHLR